MPVDDKKRSFKDTIVEALNDVVENVEHKKKEIKAVISGKTPEQIASNRKVQLKTTTKEPKKTPPDQVRPIIKNPAATALGGVHPQTVANIGSGAITQTITPIKK